MNFYKVLTQQKFDSDGYSIVPIRMEDRYAIMKWRNEQIFHLRQNKLLSKEEQDKYFNEVVAQLFEVEQPEQLLFSYLKDDKCIGYGGLVHINWGDRNAEISFIMDTELEKQYLSKSWSFFLELLEKVAFKELSLHKIYTYAFDLRPKIYKVFEKNGFKKEAILKEHVLYQGDFINVIIHSKLNL